MLNKPLRRLEDEIGDCEARIRVHDTRLASGLHALRSGATHALGGKAVMAGGALVGSLAGLWWTRSHRRHGPAHRADYRAGYRDGLRAARRHRRRDVPDMLQRWSPLLLPLMSPLLNPKVAESLSRLGVPVTLKAHPDLPTVPKLDLTRYAGRWHEVAHLAGRQEPESAAPRRDVSVEYQPDGEGGLAAHRRWVSEDGSVKEAEGRLRMPDAMHPGRLEASFAPAALRWWPGVWEDCWVLFVDEDYSAALVGTPDRTGLWVMARAATVPATDLEALRSLALRHGFDTDRLVATAHGPH